MILARTLPEALASPSRQGAGPAAKSQPGEDALPFYGILDKVADEAGMQSKPQDLGDLALPSAAQPGVVLADLDRPPPKRNPAPLIAAAGNLPFQADVSAHAGQVSPPGSAYLPGAVLTPNAAASPPVAAPAAPATPLDFAALLATLPPASAKAEDEPSAGQAPASPRSRSTGKPTLASPDPSPTSVAPDPMALSTLLGLVPMQQPPTLSLTKSDAADDAGGAPQDSPADVMPSSRGEAPAPVLPAASDLAPRSDATTGTEDFAGALTSIVRSVKVETQLAPAFPFPPMQQVIHAVQKMADMPVSQAAPTPAQAAPLPSRTMTLVLEPENLGTVTVRMQMRGGGLDLQLEVDNAQTLTLLAKEKHSLTAAMAGQDYQVGTLTLRASDTQSGSQGSDNGSRPHEQSAGGSLAGGDGAAQGQASQGGGASGGSRQEPRAARNRGRDENGGQRPAGAAAPAGSSGVYI